MRIRIECLIVSTDILSFLLSLSKTNYLRLSMLSTNAITHNNQILSVPNTKLNYGSMAVIKESLSVNKATKLIFFEFAFGVL